ncbi:MAG: flagellar hook-length control protein FliK [Candidatus Fibromonas sp.]|jgi:hypothetical protein|nr:flagellar hook-length control protein FliK [Candidatus Fibromonas sp.]
MNISTIPAPVAAELSGAGSFFGSCQIASGGFESFLQSASVASTSYETPEMPTGTEGSMADAEGSIFGMLTGYAKNKDSNEVLKKLQEILGEEAGAKVFKIMTDFLNEYVPLEQGGIANSKTVNTAPETLTIFHLMELLDPEYLAETPIAKLKAELGSILEEIKEILGHGQKEQPEMDIPQLLMEAVQPKAEIEQPGIEMPQPKTEVVQPEIEIPQPKTEAVQPKAEIVQPEIEIPQPKTEAVQPKAEIAQPEIEIPQPKTEAVQPKAEIAQPEIEIPQPKTEVVQPKAEIAQPEIEIPQPKAEAVQPKAEIAQPEIEIPLPKTEAVQPKAEIAQPEIEIPQQKTEAVQPKAEIAQPKTKIPQPKAEVVQPKTEEEKLPHVIIDIRLYSLASQLGIKPSEHLEFFELVNDLLEQGLIDLDDFDLDKAAKPQVLVVADNIKEEKELNFFGETLKELWEYVKNGDEPKKEEILSMFRQIANTKETAKELKDVSSTIGQKTENIDKENSGSTSEIPKTSEKETEIKFVNSEPVKNKSNKHREEQYVQPEVRAVWESSGLKIEIINPKTGEKLQSTQTAMPQNMQEKLQEFEVIKQVVARAKFITTPTGEQRLTIHLRPEHLGQLDLRITLSRGEMQIHARVESPTAQQALENHIGLLREGLEKQGITLERLEVSIEQKDKQDAWSLGEKHERHEQKHGQKHNHRGRESHLAVSIANEKADTGRRLGYNTMEYLA